MSSRSPEASFEVACRSTQRLKSASSMPQPSSVTRRSERPPFCATTSMDGRARVDGVLDKLLHRARRPLDHLARGDAIDLDLAELADRGHLMRRAINGTRRHREAALAAVATHAIRCPGKRMSAYPGS